LPKHFSGFRIVGDRAFFLFPLMLFHEVVSFVNQMKEALYACAEICHKRSQASRGQVPWKRRAAQDGRAHHIMLELKYEV
jgi:hypothetical protein